MIDQATFDADLAALVDAINSLIAAAEGRAVSAPDLSNEDQAIQDAAAAVAAELEKFTPAPAETPAGGAPGTVTTTEDGTITTVNGSTTTTNADGSPIG